MSELAPAYGKQGGDVALEEITKLAKSEGLLGKPKIETPPHEMDGSAAPWQRAVQAARLVRQQIGKQNDPIDDATLYGLLGLKAANIDRWSIGTRHRVALAVPMAGQKLKFIPRKRHPIAKRFEFCRFLGDYLNVSQSPEHWLASTDLTTSRQRYQRAFAAEFLCPIDSLVDFLQGDLSEPACEEAATHFGVSERTVESLLINNGRIASREVGSGFPYRLAA